MPHETRRASSGQQLHFHQNRGKKAATEAPVRLYCAMAIPRRAGSQCAGACLRVLRASAAILGALRTGPPWCMLLLAVESRLNCVYRLRPGRPAAVATCHVLTVALPISGCMAFTRLKPDLTDWSPGRSILWRLPAPAAAALATYFGVRRAAAH